MQTQKTFPTLSNPCFRSDIYTSADDLGYLSEDQKKLLNYQKNLTLDSHELEIKLLLDETFISFELDMDKANISVKQKGVSLFYFKNPFIIVYDLVVLVDKKKRVFYGNLDEMLKLFEKKTGSIFTTEELKSSIESDLQKRLTKFKMFDTKSLVPVVIAGDAQVVEVQDSAEKAAYLYTCALNHDNVSDDSNFTLLVKYHGNEVKSKYPLLEIKTFVLQQADEIFSEGPGGRLIYYQYGDDRYASHYILIWKRRDIERRIQYYSNERHIAYAVGDILASDMYAFRCTKNQFRSNLEILVRKLDELGLSL